MGGGGGRGEKGGWVWTPSVASSFDPDGFSCKDKDMRLTSSL